MKLTLQEIGSIDTVSEPLNGLYQAYDLGHSLTMIVKIKNRRADQIK